MIKRVLFKLLFNISLELNDLLYRRPYFDRGSRKIKAENEIPHLDLVITECCSLKCRDCSNLMQYYQKPENLKTESIIQDLTKLLQCVRVGELNILGGEPFVNQNSLTEILRCLSGSLRDQVGTINIITNGTIIPKEDCIDAIRNNPKAVIILSNYGKLSTRQDELIDICKENKISFILRDDAYHWFDFGQPVKYTEPYEFVRRQYKHCSVRKNCMTLYRGSVYTCPRQAHGIKLGLIPDNKDDYVNLYDSQYKNNTDLIHAVFGMYNRTEPVSACYYCIFGKYIHVPRGVQKNRL